MKKVLSLLVAVLLLVGAVPTVAYGAAVEELQTAAEQVPAEEESSAETAQEEAPQEEEEPSDSGEESGSEPAEAPKEEEAQETEAAQAASEAEPEPEDVGSPETQDVSGLGDVQVYSRSDYTLVKGVTESTFYMRNSSNDNVIGHMAVIEPNSSVAFKASYKGYYTEGSTSESRKTKAANWSDSDWGMSTVREQAAAYESAADTEKPVICAINGDYFNMSTGQPLGTLIMEGNSLNNVSEPYFAVLKDGSYAIRPAYSDTSDVQEAVSGPFMLVENGEVVESLSGDITLMPRQSVGLTADGKVILLEVDGRQEKSVGMTLYEQAKFLKAQGCVSAIYLDGGGSATFASRREGTDQLEVQNSPSDGSERNVSSALLLVSTGESDGIFDHAAITPSGEVYTPGSSVTFKAVGVDKNGGSTQLPEGVTWALAEDSAGYGAITQEGVYTDNGETSAEHKVTVQLLHQGAVVGSTSVVIAAPDEFRFTNDSINLDYEERSNLGLSVFFKGQPLHTNPGDLVWTVEDSRAGAMDGDTFVAAANNEAGNLSVKTNVTVQSKWDESVTNTVQVGIGTAPVVVLDGGDSDGLNYNNIAYVHAAANGGGLVYETHADDHGDVIVVHYEGRGAIGSAEVCDVDSGQVRFGQKALKLNYNFTNITGIEGACVGFAEDILVEGSPTAIGIWVYAPENTPNLWLRLRCKDATGTIQTLDFTQRGDLATDGTKGGINWVGWKYLTCDLTSVQGPITLIAGETFRVMDTNGGQGDMGTWVCTKDDSGNVTEPVYVGHSKGCLYLDNMQFVYGNDPADTDNPVISSVQAGGDLSNLTDIAADGSTVFHTNTLNFYTSFYDVENKRTSGIDFVNFYLDGVNLTEKCTDTVQDGKIYLYSRKLANGTHSVKVLTRDKNGNEAVVTRSFTVQGDNQGLTSVDLEKSGDSAPLGTTYDLNLTSNAVDDVAAVNAEVEVGTECPVADVAFSQGYTGTYDYNAETGVVSIQAQRTADAASTGEGTLATIHVTVPTTIKENSYMTFRVRKGDVTYVQAKDDAVINTFATAQARVPVTAAYILTADVMLVGAEYGTVTVTDTEGNAASGVRVYSVGESGDTQLGITGEDGTLSLEVFCNEVQKFTLYAKGEAGYSFRVTGQSLAEQGSTDGMPYHILNNAAKDPATTKNLSWMSNPNHSAGKAVVQYAEKSAYDAQGEEAFQSANGTCTLEDFTGSSDPSQNYAVNINSTLVTGLKPDTQYAYRVGDGAIWSEVDTFTTQKQSSDEVGQGGTKFFVVGDTQADGEDLTNVQKIAQKVATGYSFGIQVGDSVEEPQLYSKWDDILKVFSNFGDGDLLHVIGNHETFADSEAERANLIYNTPDSNYYSVTYGNVYVATIAYTEDRAELTAAANWLVRDASASSATWKVLTMHQPPYYTNAIGSNEVINELIPPAAEQAGIDFVFSGHDHAYARTYPMLQGDEAADVDESSDRYSGDGVVYYICGSTGEVKYSITNNPDFHFAKATQAFKGSYIYLSVEATDDTFTVTTYQGDQVIDTYTKESACASGGHSYATYDDGYLYCGQCGKWVRATDSGYNGFATDRESGSSMFFIGGEYQTGFCSYGSDTLLFGDNGLGATTSFAIAGTDYRYEDGRYSGCSDELAGAVEIGFCGADEDGRNLIYAYQNGNGVLNVGLNPLMDQPSGQMANWSNYRDVPWQIHRYDVVKLNVGEGVTSLGDRMLQIPLNPAASWEEDKTPQLKQVSLPSTLTSIGTSAFYNAKALTSVKVPKNVTTIGNSAFAYCTALNKVTFAGPVKKVGAKAFNQDAGVSVTFASKTVPTFGSKAFSGCGASARLTVPCTSDWVAAVKALKFPGTATYTNHAALTVTKSVNPTAKAKGYTISECSTCKSTQKAYFTLAKGKTFTSGSLIYQVSAKDKTVTVQKGAKKTLTSVSVPGTVAYGGVTYKVTAIGKAAFQNYTALKSVSVGKYVTTIGASAFYGCTKLAKVTNAAAVTTIGEKAFCHDGVLASVSSLKSCKTIGNYAFYKCYKLKKLTDTEKVTSVGKGAFQYDKALTSLSSLKSCKTIGSAAFYKCTSLTRIGSTQNRISLYAVTTIGEKAFAYCTSMTNFYDASANLKTIGASCFYGDGKLKTITLKSIVLTSKSVGANAFKGIYAKAKIKVPAAKLKQYQSYLKGKGQGSKVQIVKY